MEDLFKNNKYTIWYHNIIRNATLRGKIDEYTERHHIIPKCFGGSNNSKNLVILTAREHFICHRLLIKMTSGVPRQKMCFAVNMMMNVKNKHQTNRDMYFVDICIS